MQVKRIEIFKYKERLLSHHNFTSIQPHLWRRTPLLIIISMIIAKNMNSSRTMHLIINCPFYPSFVSIQASQGGKCTTTMNCRWHFANISCYLQLTAKSHNTCRYAHLLWNYLNFSLLVWSKAVIILMREKTSETMHKKLIPVLILDLLNF